MADEHKPSAPPARPLGAPKADPEGPPAAAAVHAKKVDHDKLIAEAMEAERKANPLAPDTKVDYGIFKDNPQKFRVLHEGVGRFGAGEIITYRDLIVWNPKAMGSGSAPDMESPNVTQTKANVDRLIGLGAIEIVREYA